MKQPDELGRAAEMLYGDADNAKSKVSNPPHIYNPHGRPSIIPGIQYPISDREEHLLDLAWNHFCDLKNRGLL